MASGTIENDRDRKMTIMTTTFIPCGAKVPFIGMIAGAIFGGSAWVATSSYFVGMAAIIISGIMLKKTKMFAGDPAPFVMELPAYHMPTLGNVLRSMWERGWSFIKKAGTIILLSTIAVWCTSYFGFTDEGFRMLAEDVDKLYVRSANGEMVPFSAFTTSHWVYGSPRLERYNGLPSMEIQGEAAPGTSSGDAMALMENLASKLPAGIGYDWTGMSYQERLSGNQAPALVAISFVVVFLCLAALYESWSIPVSVMLVVPLGIVGVLLAATLFNQKNDVYFMVGLLTTIGLSAKNAILIVEFAKDLMEKEGKGVVEATLMAVRMRLRPILMTSLAFILGVLPLAISNGAGSGAQNAVGIGVMGGMVSATLLAIFFVPVFFVVIRRCFKG